MNVSVSVCPCDLWILFCMDIIIFVEPNIIGSPMKIN